MVVLLSVRNTYINAKNLKLLRLCKFCGSYVVLEKRKQAKESMSFCAVLICENDFLGRMNGKAASKTKILSVVAFQILLYYLGEFSAVESLIYWDLSM